MRVANAAKSVSLTFDKGSPRKSKLWLGNELVEEQPEVQEVEMSRNVENMLNSADLIKTSANKLEGWALWHE